MSRSRKKYAKTGFCYGDNTPYYKLARKHLRTLNKQNLRHLIANFHIDDVADKVMSFQNKHDTKYDEGNEPTDGTYIVTKEDEYWTKERIKKLKRK